MKVIFLHQIIALHDAIGNDISQMYNLLNKKHSSFVYCDHLANKSLNLLSKKELYNYIKDSDNLIIYHHSGYWKDGEEILEEAKCKIIIRYHNVTPASYFKNYNDTYYKFCAMGRKQTQRFNDLYSEQLWLSDSQFNSKDIEGDNVKVLAPLNNIESWDKIKPDEKTIKRLIEGPKRNILFVGRIAPNKGHKFLIKVINDYLKYYGDNILLNIVGKRDIALDKYIAELEELIDHYGLKENIRFTEEINDQILISYYLASDLYMSCSDHEGFAVPLLEAQYLHLPIIAKESTAIPETLGSQQLTLGEDLRYYSSAIKVVLDNPDYKNYLIKKGIENYNNRFRSDILKEQFTDIIKEYTAAGV